MIIFFITIIMFKNYIYKDCEYSSICKHNRVELKCKECNSVRLKKTKILCKHNKQKAFCKECGGSQICPHNRQKAICKECGGSQICPHNRQKQWCKECNKKPICIHGKINCKECILANSKELKMLNIIRELNKNDINNSINIIKNKYNICEHNNIKTNCYTCQNNFITSMLN